MGAEQPVKLAAHSHKITLRSLAGQHGTPVLGICSITFILHSLR
jgi:hypothetical protein